MLFEKVIIIITVDESTHFIYFINSINKSLPSRAPISARTYAVVEVENYFINKIIASRDQVGLSHIIFKAIKSDIFLSVAILKTISLQCVAGSLLLLCIFHNIN